MNTIYDKENIQAYFKGLSENKTMDEQIENEAMMLHFRIMQLVEKAMDKKGWNKKKLAEKLGKSQSYLTQLFLGHKMMNLTMMAAFQKTLALNFKLEIEHADETIFFWKLKKTLPSLNDDVKQEKVTKVRLNDKQIEKAIEAA
jgi:ribosome-binding protein aMBF1 (putative translation factor)